MLEPVDVSCVARRSRELLYFEVILTNYTSYSKHLEGVLPLHERNKIIWGGAMFSHPPADGEDPPPMVGSALLVYASSKEEVLELLKNDIYSKNDVWNLEKMQIWPFRSAVRSDLSSTSDLHPVQSNVQGS